MSTSMERVLRARFVQMVFLSCDMADFPIEVASLACKFAHRYVNHVGLDVSGKLSVEFYYDL